MYRKEAAEYSRNRRSGKVITFPKIGSVHLFSIFSLAFLVLFACLFIFTYQNKLHVDGITIYTDGAITLDSQVSGRIGTLNVTVGDQVKTGDVLAIITTDYFNAGENGNLLTEIQKLQESILIQNDSLAELVDSKYIVEAETLALKIKGLNTTKHEIDQLVISKGRDLVIKEKWFEITKDLYKKGARSGLELDKSEGEFLAVHGELKQLNIQLEAVKIQIAESAQNLKSIPFRKQLEIKDLFEDKLAAKKALVDVSQKSGHFILAPFDGVVDGIHFRTDQRVELGDGLISMHRQKSQLVGQLNLSSETRGFAQLGQEVELKYDAYAYQKYGVIKGKIIAINESGKVEANGSVNYAALVELQKTNVMDHDVSLPIMPSMTFKASLLLESRTLMNWLLSKIGGV